MANDFWRQVFGYPHIRSLNNQFVAVFQLIELVCDRREHYVGDLEPLRKTLRVCDVRMEKAQAGVDTPMDEQPARVEGHQYQDSDGSTLY